jgi:hypothetical protein
MNDQCAVGPDGRLLDASQIQFFNDPDDSTPLPPVLPIAANTQACEGMLLLSLMKL